MTIEQVVLENIRDLPTEKQQQVLDFVTFLKQQTTINLQSSSQGSRKSYKGMWADLGINITDEDITAARQEGTGQLMRDEC